MTNQIPSSIRLAGILTAAELRAAGVSPVQVKRLVRQRALISLARGVYLPTDHPGGCPRDPAGVHALRVATAVAKLGPGHVGSHRSAAVLHGLDLLGRVPEQVEVTRAPLDVGSRASRGGVRVHSAALPSEHVDSCHGVPVTSVSRTVIDLARSSSFQAGVAAADSALHRKLLTREDLAPVLLACAGWRRQGQAREVAAFTDARSESVLESISRVAFRDHGLPPPELQVWVGGDEGTVGRADFLWREFRTVAEADGAVKYADPARAVAQLDRDKRLRQAGFEVVHFTWNEIVRVPWQVAAEIRQAFRRGTG